MRRSLEWGKLAYIPQYERQLAISMVSEGHRFTQYKNVSFS